MTTCPDCGGPVWDNRPKKATGEFSAKSPDFKCKDKECGGVIWPGETVEVLTEKPRSVPKHGIPQARDGDKIDEYAQHAGRIFAAAWAQSLKSMELIPEKDAEEMSVEAWTDLRLRIAQGFAIEINKIIRKERF